MTPMSADSEAHGHSYRCRLTLLISTWDPRHGTAIVFQQHSTFDTSHLPGVIHGSVAPCRENGDLFDKYQERHSLELREVAYFDLDQKTLDKPLPSGWVMHIVPPEGLQAGRRYYHHPEHGTTWLRPDLHPWSELFSHRVPEVPVHFHPPTHPIAAPVQGGQRA
jgi:hypothetical protein